MDDSSISRELEAQEYLRRHKVLELLNTLTSLLLFHRPERTREFLINELEKLKLARVTDKDYPSLFDESNLVAVFGILDPAQQGFISVTQYKEALKTLGIEMTNLPWPDNAMINQETFKQQVLSELKKANRTFKS
ncbi:EF-hand calcium-binding domain-containing protein 10 [Microcaecilia unicolor]|uniref:EF-hand calcium-binding domain-containing protein 10 n=1 Tax=Microcaecilia unicolor TaxID=1415580 RepID=A0A6P7ZBX4_9AMPH|nr:EF-hand calcium-binding domain-containing protein 10 [Microcaecilia unicolor]XP_030072886.1 EF-hand calcium-binding domain-containing protein 10 [Microcaecilia unicolor]XP_030072887.1 EF-hand calcium-binding domain-containing protein 10 [Microcaecilia unicolor]